MIRAGLAALVVPGLVVLMLGCGPTKPSEEKAKKSGPIWLEDVTDKVGLDFVHEAGPVGDYFMPQQVGSGAALFDFDRDGRLDIYLLQNGGPKGACSRLYRQMPNRTFKEVANSGLEIAGFNMGVCVGDVNNDGWPDVLVTQYDGIKLFLNRGDGRTFKDVTEQAGLHNPSWGASAAFFDYDRDGWLDLVVINYVDYDPTWPCKGDGGRQDYCAPKTFKGRVSRLFHNLGGREANNEKSCLREIDFQDVTEKSGLGRLPGPGLGVMCYDFDGDGWPDILVANDGQANRLWINRHDGIFQEEAVRRGVAYNGMAQAQAGMGVALGDVDRDGLLDLFITHLPGEGNTLWRQGPRGLYRDSSSAASLVNTAWRATGFGTLLMDMDHDGHLDLAIANGSVRARANIKDDSLGPFWSAYGERNQLFHNRGGGQFEDISEENAPFCGAMNVARGLVRGDIDGDGAQDVLLTTIVGRARLFRNVAPKKGHWLEVRAFDPLWKRDALGSEVSVSAGDRTCVSWLHPAESYLCSSEPVAHFGLGDAENVRRIEVVWPDGKRESFPGVSVDQRITLNRGEGSLRSKEVRRPPARK
jgi:hypothetical protein